MKGEYKMFIDSLSERNKSKNAIKGFNPCIELSLLIISYFKEPQVYLILLLLNRWMLPLLILIIYIFKGNVSLVKITLLPL